MIENTIIDEIREKTDIVSVVSDYVALRKRGKNYLALCPFHSEKTPSFTVSQDKQIFHCFGCNEGGNVFSFLMKIENISFLEAAKLLADKLGIPFSAPDNFKPAKSSDNDKLYAINELAAQFYETQIDGSDIAKDYIKKRGLNKQVLSTFRIGYSPDNWDQAYRFLASKGFLPKDIEKAGLIIPRENNSSYYDRFRNRLMFPIFDVKGRAVGFGARSLDGLPAGQAGSEPKYINSPDSPVYNKSNILYGLNLSKEHIKSSDSVLIMEGYMDLISAYSSGLKNVVASSGTSLTANQAKLVRRYTNNFILVFDSDAAGSLASERSIELLKELDIYPKIAVLSGGKDPDEILLKEGKEKLEELIKGAVPWLRYKLRRVISRYNIKEPEGKAKAVKEAAIVLSKEKDRIIRDEYIKLFSSKLNIDLDSMLSEVKRLDYFGKHSKKGKNDFINKPASKIEKAERTLIKIAVEDAPARQAIIKDLSGNDFSDSMKKSIFETIVSSSDIQEENIYSLIVDALQTEEEKKEFSRIIMEEHEMMDQEKTVQDCINVIKSNNLKGRIEALRDKISIAEKNRDIEALSLLQNEYKQCHEQMRAL